MEHKFICFEMALLAMQAAQYIKAIEGYHVTTSISPNRGRLELTIFSKSPEVECLPDGYLYSKREFKSLGVVNDADVFTTSYYFYF